MAYWEVVAWVAYEQFFAGHGTVGALDETFLGRDPVLLIAEPRSLLVSGAKRAEGRTAEDWKPLLAAMKALEFASSDAGAGLTKALDEAGIPRSADLFHLLGEPEAWLARFEKKVRAECAAVEKARLVAETRTWRRTDKISVEWLARASTGSVADEAELAGAASARAIARLNWPASNCRRTTGSNSSNGSRRTSTAPPARPA